MPKPFIMLSIKCEIRTQFRANGKTKLVMSYTEKEINLVLLSFLFVKAFCMITIKI